MKVPKIYWGEAILAATYLINRMPSRVLAFKSPIETLLEFFPNFQGTNKALKFIFLGHSHDHLSNIYNYLSNIYDHSPHPIPFKSD